MSATPALKYTNNFNNELINVASVIKIFKYRFATEQGRNIYSSTDSDFINSFVTSNEYLPETLIEGQKINLIINIDPIEDFINKGYKWILLYYDDLLTGETSNLGIIIDIGALGLITTSSSPMDDEKNFFTFYFNNLKCDLQPFQNSIVHHMENEEMKRVEGRPAALQIDNFINKHSGIKLLLENKYNEEYYSDSLALDRFGLKY